ncbi:PHD finger protein 10 isoform X2 [Nematostella vectensis]|uniref:PHD finger protein 10 isoform X2 n=1 Tax=Nematostella vectensis TaxID=45351 RepID=UPI00207797E3|nr:PHD finger protein 10 isoform X2 [Nematostella vectensis]
MPRKKKPGPKPKSEVAKLDNESPPKDSKTKPSDNEPKDDPVAEQPVMPIKRPRGRPSKKWQAQFLGKVFPEPVKSAKKERKPREKKEKPKEKQEKKPKKASSEKKEPEEVTAKDQAPTPQASLEEVEPPKDIPPLPPPVPKEKPIVAYLKSLRNILDKLHEYKWPADGDGQYYYLTSQIAHFLGIESLQEKHPKIEFHVLQEDEKSFLLENGFLDSAQKDQEIWSICSEDATQLVLDHYPDKYQDFIQISHKREKYKLLKKSEEEKEAQESRKIPNSMRRALKNAVDFNSQLALQRKEERQSYFDMQTQIIHVPCNRSAKLPQHLTQPSMYPVSLLPGQYQEHYKRYLPSELRQLPLGTALDRVLERMTMNFPQRAETDSSELSTSSSSSSSSGDDSDDSNDSDDSEDSKSGSDMEQDGRLEPPAKKKTPAFKPPFRPDALCGICLMGSESNKKGLPEEMIHCSHCENSGHPSCLDMNQHLVKVIETYPWQCMECKTCTLCRDPFDEDKMLFCDECDRGYHSFCVGLKQIPVGRWTCELCGVCASCSSPPPFPTLTPPMYS